MSSTSNFVWPYLFTLRATQLNLSDAGQQTLEALRAKMFPGSNGSNAVALRWSSSPSLGFPRQPFQLYRRARNSLESAAAGTVLATPVAVTATPQTLSVMPGDAAYVVTVTVTVASGGSATVQVIDVYGNAIPGQSVTMTTSGRLGFRCPGIASVSISGSGAATTVGPITAVGQSAYANLPDWTIIQTVGLPLENNEIGTSYVTSPQGIWPNATTPPTLAGLTFANNRMIIASQLQAAPPATGIADFPLPAWPAPNPTAYVAALRLPGSSVPMIESCLENCVDSDPTKLQVNYTETIAVDPPSQPGMPVASPAPGSGSPETSVASVPVVATTMLSVSTDSFAAVALGYGTYDIPPDLSATPAGAVAITLTPTSAAVKTGGSVQFTATVTGSSNTSVIWCVNGVTGGNPELGFITNGLFYPADVADTTISATSVADPSKSASAPVSIFNPTVGAGAAAVPIALPAPVAAPAGEVPPPAPGSTPITLTPVGVHLPIVTLPPTLPAADDYGAFDYMVTAPFVFSFGFNGSMAALSGGQPPVVAPTNLYSVLSNVYAPLERDATAPAAIQLSWSPAAIPQGYGIVASRAPNHSEVLNSPRPAGVGGYNAYIGLPPANPDPNNPLNQNATFTDVDCKLPLGPPGSPDINDRYLVAGLDVFGQWSAWVETSTMLEPAPVTQPGLLAAQFNMNTGSPPGSALHGGHVVSATLQIDFAWDWQNRAPGEIRFTGQFVPAVASTLNPPYLGGFAMSNTGSPASPDQPVILQFSYAGHDPDTVEPDLIIPTIQAPHTDVGGVEIIGKTGSPPSALANRQQIQYRVQISGMTLDFSASSELDFVVYATATEYVRPGVWSDVHDMSGASQAGSPPQPLFIGKIVRALDPTPPVVTFTPPRISWTALPDATGMARGVLEWTPDPTAAGYFVWEATESALLNILPPGSPGGGTADAPPGTPYVTRAETIKALVNAHQDASLQGFARLTQQPITASRSEIIVPGTAQTLYLFRISAISVNNVEAPRSDTFAIFGVPRRHVPGTPRIMLRSVSSSPGGIQAIVLPVASGQMPAPASSSPGERPGGFRLFRVRSQQLSLDGSTMGPAKYDEFSAAWQEYSSTTLAGSPLNGMSLIDTAATTSWYPYYYRATAVGVEDLDNGLYSGESEYSSALAGYALPVNPPLIQAPTVAISSGKNAALVTLVTDLPAAAASPVGPALVELLQIASGGSPQSPQSLVSLLSSAPNQLAVGSLSVNSAPGSGRMARSQPDANGRWTLSILIPYSPAEKNSFIVRLTDPLARQSTTSF